MKFYCTKTLGGFIPLEDEKEKFAKLVIGDVYEFSIKLVRNYEFHKKFFALLKVGCENSKSIDAPLDVYRKYALIKSGYCQIYTTPKGKFVEADSIAFDKMDEFEFSQVYNRVFDFIIKDTEADRELFEKELQSFI
jgi:hypothetical protein